MIIYMKKDEVDQLIKHLENIEENFWLKYKLYNESNREFIKKEFEELYNKLYALSDKHGEQLEMEM